MDAVTYRFDVGEFQCTAVADGSFAYAPPIFPQPGVFLFQNAVPADREQLLAERGLESQRWPSWTSPYTCLLIRTGKSVILVDTGAGKLGPNTGRLLASLRSVSVSPDDVDTIILTHAHPDHLGGNVGEDGKVVFSRARFVIWKTEWDFWMSGMAEKVVDEHMRAVLVGTARKNLAPIESQADLLTEEKEIAPGITVLAAPGHTTGQIAVGVSSGGAKLLCVSDVVLHPVHLERTGWRAAVDMLPDKTTETRNRILNKAVSENAIVMAFHFPFPGIGRVVASRDAWQWQPLV